MVALPNGNTSRWYLNWRKVKKEGHNLEELLLDHPKYNSKMFCHRKLQHD
jgi:hypothetical protein